MRLKKLYHDGTHRLEQELDILKILKSLRNMKILLKNKFLDEEMQFQIEHNNKNVISLSSCSSSEELD